MSVERNFHDVGDAEGADDCWVQAGKACDRLLARLEKFHGDKEKTARTAKCEPSNGSGSGEPESTNQRHPARSDIDDHP